MAILLSEDCHPKRLVSKYAETHPPGFLHGDSHSGKVPRKIVCTEEMLENGDFPMENVQAYPMTNLKQRFLQELKEQTLQAVTSQSRVVLFLLGHGSFDDLADVYRFKVGTQ